MKQTQEMFMRQSLCDSANGGGSAAIPSLAPFLNSAANELHNRQESADSGVGLGSNFNLGCIPEDLPDDMELAEEDLDTTLTAVDQTTNQQQAKDELGSGTAAAAAAADVSQDLNVIMKDATWL
jgi:hypothetical protein